MLIIREKKSKKDNNNKNYGETVRQSKQQELLPKLFNRSLVSSFVDLFGRLANSYKKSDANSSKRTTIN